MSIIQVDIEGGGRVIARDRTRYFVQQKIHLRVSIL